MATYVIKRNGNRVEFDAKKIYFAIYKAMKYGSGIVNVDLAEDIAKQIEKECSHLKEVTISTIETMVYIKLTESGDILTAKAYEGFRAVQEFKRSSNTTDEDILNLVNGTNEEAMNENSNKNARKTSTQRDLIAGEVSKDIARRKLIPARIVQAHDAGIIHYHDMDYAIQPMPNCCLVNLKDMLNNGTVINGKLIESPNSFRTACTIATQIMAQISSGQYGGQTMSVSHLAPFIRRSRERYYKMLKDAILDIDNLNKTVDILTTKEIEDGVQTIQYQINTLLSSNGQSPFVSLFLYANEDPEYKEETQLIIDELIRQRKLGIKNEKGVYVTVEFPKLLYVLDDSNDHEGSEYWESTVKAAECNITRMSPDIISAKKMMENYGDVFPCMGCRSFLSPFKDKNGKFKWYGRQNLGVVTINLVDVALSANKDMRRFWNILEQRLELCKEALDVRIDLLRGHTADVSPIHWMHGGIARLKSGELIDKVIDSGICTASLGYIGLYEMTQAMLGVSHTDPKGKEFALKVMKHMKATTAEWSVNSPVKFSLYGTPAESTTYKFARKLKSRFGIIPEVTDHDYITNSYHINVREKIDAFSKVAFESEFQDISSGGAISYVEVPHMFDNVDAILELFKYFSNNIQYCEINTKSDFCMQCGYDGEIKYDKETRQWYCPNCGNTNKALMNVTRRTCGYLGSNFWNEGRTQDIVDRVVHLD